MKFAIIAEFTKNIYCI